MMRSFAQHISDKTGEDYDAVERHVRYVNSGSTTSVGAHHVCSDASNTSSILQRKHCLIPTANQNIMIQVNLMKSCASLVGRLEI